MMFIVDSGFSTFSTAINELSLIRTRKFRAGDRYGVATVAVPLICVAIGFDIAMPPIPRNCRVSCDIVIAYRNSKASLGADA